jgi:predicted membrane protein
MLRGISLVLASLATIVGLIFPYALARQATALNQTVLLAMLVAVSGAFIYGVGFRTDRKWFDIMIGPFVTWPVLAAAVGTLILLR